MDFIVLADLAEFYRADFEAKSAVLDKYIDDRPVEIAGWSLFFGLGVVCSGY